MNTTGRRPLRLLAAILSLWCVSPCVGAAEPAIRLLDVRGLRVGGTTTLTIDGDDLGTAPRLLLPFSAKQSLQPKATDKKAVFDVVLDGDVQPGYYHLRVVSESGISLPVVIGVDRMTQAPLMPTVSELPTCLHGTVAGGATVETKFQGNAKQKVMIEVEAQRLGSKLRPIVHLYTPKKLQLAWSWGTPALFGDTRLEAILPEDGTYSVTLHDAEYAAVAPSFFRLKLGEWSYVDQIFPPALATNQSASIELLGMKTPEAVKVGASKNAQILPLPFPKAGVWSGPRPFVTVSSHPEFVKQAAKDKLQELPEGLLGVSGRLLTPFVEDQYRVLVKPGQKVRLEVFAERIGSPIDAALVVRNDKGAQLVRAEDSPGTLDPILEYTVPDKVTSIIVGVIDAQGRGGPRGVYRLVIDPQTPASNKGGFKLTTTVPRISLAASGRVLVPVSVERRGYQGKIDLAANLPAGLKLDGATIPEGADGTLVSLERNGAAFEAIITGWRGRTDAGEESQITLKGHPLERLQPWLATEIAIAPTSVKAPEFAVDWRDLPPDVAIVPASRLLLPVKLTRPTDKTTVKLTLLTSQNTPLLNNAPDVNKAIRQDKLGELAANVSTGDVTLLAPPDLSAPTYDVTVQAELLDPAKKVLATAYTPVRRMIVRNPLVVKLSGPERIEAPFDPKKGTTVKVTGKIERLAGLKADVALAFTGLPVGAKAEAVTVKADATDFALTITFPATIPASFCKHLPSDLRILP